MIKKGLTFLSILCIIFLIGCQQESTETYENEKSINANELLIEANANDLQEMKKSLKDLEKNMTVKDAKITDLQSQVDDNDKDNTVIFLYGITMGSIIGGLAVVCFRSPSILKTK